MISDSITKPIVHIATDEKFIDAAYDIYEKALPGKNGFVILLGGNKDKIKHLSHEKDYEYVDTSDNYLSVIKRKIAEARVLVFHEMTYHQAQVVLSLKKKNLTYIWTVFGHEVYSNPYLFGKELYGNKTYKKIVFSFKKVLKNKLRPYYYRFWKQKKEPNKSRIQAFKQMDYVGILYKEELQLYEQKMDLNSNIQQLKFTYYPLDIVIDENQQQVSQGNILLGNSASYMNNHIEAFDILKKMNLGSREIIAPLSYGNDEYAEQIVKKGKVIFGNSFKPLTRFLPLKEYQQVIQKCGIVIMNHYRQQAVGNVLNTIFLGAKVYLSKKNTLYHYLKRIGCHVYCIEEDLKPNNQYAFQLLSSRKMEENREFLRKELSLDRICQELNQIINPYLK